MKRLDNDIAALPGNSILSGGIALQQRLQKWSGLVVYPVILVSVIMLAGWIFRVDIFTRLLPGINPMNPASALLFLICAICIVLSYPPALSIKKVRWCYLLTGLVIVIAGARFLSLLQIIDFPVDTFLFNKRLPRDANDNIYPRMAPATALNFLLFGSALLMSRPGSKGKYFPSHLLFLAIVLISLLSIVGHLYRVDNYVDSMPYLNMAMHSATCFLLLSFGGLLIYPGKGFMSELTSPYTGSFIARFLLPAAIIVPVLLGFLRLHAGWRGWLSLEAGVSMLVLTIIIIFLLMTWFIVVSINKRDHIKHISDTALRESEEQVQTIFSATPDAVIVIDEKGIIQQWNPTAEKMLGWKKEEVIGQPFGTTLFRPEFRSFFDNGLRDYLATGEDRMVGKPIETEVLTKHGKDLEVAFNIAASPVTKGQIFFVGFMRDLTGKKKAERKFRDLLDSAPDAIIIADEKGRIVLINQQTEILFGYNRHELIGKPVENLIPTDVRHRHEHHREQFFKDPRVRSMGLGLELRAVRSDGSHFPVEISLSPIQTEDGLLVAASVRDITDRKKAEEKFRSLLDAAPDATIIVNENGIIQMVNYQAEKLFGYNRDELLGQPVEILVPIELRHKHGGHRDQFMKSSKAREMGVGLELKAVKKSGEKFPVEISLSPIHMEDGLLVSASVRDITERKKAQEQINYMAKLVEETSEAVFSYDLSLKARSWNKAAESLFGYTASEVIGRNISDIVRSQIDAERRQAIIKELQETGYWKGELVYLAKDGSPLYILISNTLTRDMNGDPNGYVSVCRDISERIKAEKALSQLNIELEMRVKERTEEVVAREKRFRALIENSDDIIALLDEKFYPVYQSPSAERLLGNSHEGALQELRFDQVHPEDEPLVKQWMSELMTSPGKSIPVTYRLKQKSGNYIWLEGTFTNLFNEPAVQAIVANMRDITERKKAENEVLRLNIELEEKVNRRTEELRAANKEMEAFTYSVSHDLRAPLRGIIGFTTILEEDYTNQLDDEAKRIMSVIRTNTMQMGRLIDDLLTFSRTGKQELMRTQINTMAMVKNIIDDLAFQNKSIDKIQWEIHPLEPLKADINLIRQVWINLISNAVKYTSTRDTPTVEIGSNANGGQTVFYVRDNGVGFDEQYKHKLFKVFQRLHSADEFEGTGVGLALVEKVVSRHGGKVWAEGKPGEGACFYFSLPND